SNQLNHLADILHQHEESRRQWVADTSHELKTPLAVLQAQIEAMQDGIRKATPEHLDAMMRQVSSLKKLTQDLADLAQADAQQLKCYFAQVNPWEVVLQEVDNFKSNFGQNQLEVSVSGSGADLSLDRDRLKQIIVNLLGNCVRYTEQGGKIHIHTQQNQQQWQLYVDDSPLGVSDAQLARLGERFYRVDDSRTRSTGGTGLGLALSCQLAQALGGSLKFEHSPLGGLRCVLTFPKNQ
ncbi:MAG: sensor histidine kinase efflux regulator BaeS, partial [Acinetobacter sp.]|nr:sensor histidine kinase efflux regulator BaeS [Acinetobacter sp.]